MVEGSQLIPDGASEVLPNDCLCLTGGFMSFLVGSKGVEDGELRHDMKHLEEALALVGAAVCRFIEGRIG